MNAVNTGLLKPQARARVASKEPIHEYSDAPPIESRENNRLSLFARDELFLNNKSYCGVIGAEAGETRFETPGSREITIH